MHAHTVHADTFVCALKARPPAHPHRCPLIRQKVLLADLNLNVPPSEQQQYIDLILANHDVFSKPTSDLGRANNFKHEIKIANNLAYLCQTISHC